MVKSVILVKQEDGDYKRGSKWALCGRLVVQMLNARPERVRASVSRHPVKGSVAVVRDAAYPIRVWLRGEERLLYFEALNVLQEAGIPLGGRFYLKLEAVE